MQSKIFARERAALRRLCSEISRLEMTLKRLALWTLEFCFRAGARTKIALFFRVGSVFRCYIKVGTVRLKDFLFLEEK